MNPLRIRKQREENKADRIEKNNQPSVRSSKTWVSKDGKREYTKTPYGTSCVFIGRRKSQAALTLDELQKMTDEMSMRKALRKLTKSKITDIATEAGAKFRASTKKEDMVVGLSAWITGMGEEE